MSALRRRTLTFALRQGWHALNVDICRLQFAVVGLSVDHAEGRQVSRGCVRKCNDTRPSINKGVEHVHWRRSLPSKPDCELSYVQCDSGLVAVRDVTERRPQLIMSINTPD